ncbi:hypothetical protein LSM04_008605 [Trypanosoma melophagium]|uniref:uncharacterized protein n=1 Tax=Trypanosoma melophagium TaxID=715481 RepID=UPI00351AA819|nr:hypothetical protein LSM04_008605 [Trypanosoma melophagium]
MKSTPTKRSNLTTPSTSPSKAPATPKVAATTPKAAATPKTSATPKAAATPKTAGTPKAAAATEGKVSSKTKPVKSVDKTISPEKCFLSELESLNRSERAKRSVSLGREASQEGDNSEKLQLLSKLSQSSIPYERLTGSFGLIQNDCKTEIARLLKDTLDSIALLVMPKAAASLSDSEILQLFEELPIHRISFFCKNLEKKKRLPKLVDQFFASSSLATAAGGRTLHVVLLCWASEETLNRQPASILSQLKRNEWYTLTRRLPDFASKFVTDEIQSVVNTTLGVKNRAHMVLHALHRYHPDIGLQLLTKVTERIKVSAACITLYARKYPTDVTELVLKHKMQGVLIGWSFLKKLEPEVVIKLYDAKSLETQCLSTFFVEAPSSVRSLLYSQRRNLLLNNYGVLDPLLIESIKDAKQREIEAMKALKEAKDLRIEEVTSWISYLSLIPFPEAKELGKDYLNHQDVHIRGAACAAVVSSGVFHPKYLDDILDFCLARGNEKDRVKREIIFRLSELPPSRWNKDHYKKLAKIILRPCEAKDTSSLTLTSAMTLIFRTSRYTSELIDTSLSEIVKRYDGMCSMEQYQVPVFAVKRMWSCLLPFMTKALPKENGFSVSSTIFGFGYNLKHLSESALPFLKSMCEAPSRETAKSGVTNLLKYFRPMSIKLIPDILAKSADLIHLPILQDTLSRSIQGKLLEQYLVPLKVTGRFISSGTGPIIAFNNGHLWTAAQQQKYATSIIKYLSDEDHKLQHEEPLMAALEKLNSANVTEAVKPFVDEKYGNVLLRERAIELLGRQNDEASLSLLTDALNDSRARVAVYALQCRLRRLPSSEVIKVLDPALHSKSVAVQKVAVRIIGDIGDETAYEALTKFRQDVKLHEDVEIAWIHAMFKYLEKTEIWDILIERAKSGSEAVVKSMASIPEDNLVESWQRERLHELFVLLLSHEESSVSLCALDRLTERPLGSYDIKIKDCLLELLRSHPGQIFLPPIIHVLASTDADPSVIASQLATLEEWRLKNVVYSLTALQRKKKERFESIAVEFAKALFEKRVQIGVACLLICELPEDEMEALLEDAVKMDLLHPGAVNSAVQRIRCERENIKMKDKLEERLRNHQNPYMKRIGLALLSAIAAVDGWNEKRYEALKVYQNADDLWVSEDAKSVEPPAL